MKITVFMYQFLTKIQKRVTNFGDLTLNTEGVKAWNDYYIELSNGIKISHDGVRRKVEYLDGFVREDGYGNFKSKKRNPEIDG